MLVIGERRYDRKAFLVIARKGVPVARGQRHRGGLAARGGQRFAQPIGPASRRFREVVLDRREIDLGQRAVGAQDEMHARQHRIVEDAWRSCRSSPRKPARRIAPKRCREARCHTARAAHRRGKRPNGRTDRGARTARRAGVPASRARPPRCRGALAPRPGRARRAERFREYVRAPCHHGSAARSRCATSTLATLRRRNGVHAPRGTAIGEEAT